MKPKTLVLTCLAVVLLGAAGYSALTTARPEPQAATGASPKAEAAAPAATTTTQPHVTLTFTFTRANHRASNQYAAWIENDQGQLVKQLVVTRFAASPKAAERPDSLPTWTSHVKGKVDTALLDSVTSATPTSGLQRYTWDLTDTTGKPVPNGSYTFYLTGTQDKGKQLEWSGTITVQNGQASILTPLAPIEALPTLNEAPIIQDPALS